MTFLIIYIVFGLVTAFFYLYPRKGEEMTLSVIELFFLAPSLVLFWPVFAWLAVGYFISGEQSVEWLANKLGDLEDAFRRFLEKKILILFPILFLISCASHNGPDNFQVGQEVLVHGVNRGFIIRCHPALHEYDVRYRTESGFVASVTVKCYEIKPVVR